MSRKPSLSQNKIVSIDSARNDGPSLPPPSASGTIRKRNITNQHTASQAVARFFGMGKNVYQIHRETGFPVAALQEEIRRVGYSAWERKVRGVAA